MPKASSLRRGHPPSLSVRIVLVVALAIAFVLCTAVLDGGTGVVPPALWMHPAWMAWWVTPLREVLNALPGLLLAFVLLAWTRRAGWSFVLAFALQGLLYRVNALKVQNLAVPLMPADFRMLSQVGHGGGDLLSGYLPHLALLIVVLLACIAALVVWFRFEPPLFRPRRQSGRVVTGVVLATALATLLAGVPFWNAVYNPKPLGMRPWSSSVTRQNAGLVGSLLMYHLQYGSEHAKPDVPAALRLIARFDPEVQAHPQPASGAGSQKPDIVVILSESFFDPTILNGYPPGTDLAPNIRRLAQHGISGWLHVPTFGGGTIRTGFEVLTGMPLRYLPGVQFPWLQIHQKTIPGIVRTLEQDGYTTLAVHGNNPGFWNRTEAFKEIGFDKFISIDDFPADDRIKDGNYLSDKSFTDELLRQLPDSGPPRFVFGISIEAHGPYDSSPGVDAAVRDAIPVPKGITDPKAKLELQNYIYHMQHADQQLGRLVDTLAKRKRRTLILFFGDHLPAIVSAFQQAGFTNGKGFLEQAVPYVLIDTAHVDHPIRRNTAAWALPGMVLKLAGIHEPYFALTEAVAPQLADLTRAPDAPPTPESTAQHQLDSGMRNVVQLRLAHKLAKLWPEAAAMAQQGLPVGTASRSPHPPDASHRPPSSGRG